MLNEESDDMRKNLMVCKQCYFCYINVEIIGTRVPVFLKPLCGFVYDCPIIILMTILIIFLNFLLGGRIGVGF